jgi:hypothetical protein
LSPVTVQLVEVAVRGVEQVTGVVDSLAGAVPSKTLKLVAGELKELLDGVQVRVRELAVTDVGLLRCGAAGADVAVVVETSFEAIELPAPFLASTVK